MVEFSKVRNRQRSWLRFFARALGLLASSFWLFALIASFVGELSEGQYQQSFEGVLLFLLVLSVSVGVAVAWRREEVGGPFVIFLALGLCVFAYFSAGFNKLFAVAVSGLPFLVSGILFVLSSRGRERTSR